MSEQQKQQNFTRNSAERSSVAQDREKMSVETQQRPGPGLCLKLAPRFRLGIASGLALAGGQALPPLAARRLLKGWEADRKAGTAKFSLALCIAPCPITLPVKPGGQLLWSGLWGQAQLQGRAVIMTHPLKSSNAAGELASLSDSSLPAAIWPSFPKCCFHQVSSLRNL